MLAKSKKNNLGLEENMMEERKVSFRLLQAIAGYAAINLVFAMLALQFKPDIKVTVLFVAVSIGGWLHFCILQYRVQHYEKLLVEYSVLIQLIESPLAIAKALSAKREMERFEKSFPLTIKIIKLLEGRR